jgi:hypothetical protein
MVRRQLDLAKMAGIRSDLAKTVGIQPDLDGSGRVRPESGNSDRTLPDSGSICQTLIFAFCNFFVRAKRRKIFFLKMILPKIFYDENHFTSKQMKQ